MTTKHDFLIKIVPKLIILAGFVLCLTSLVWYGIILISFSIGFLFRHHITWAPAAEKVYKISEQEPDADVKPLPVPKSRILGVVLSNNSTDDRYTILTSNKFGLSWAIVEKNINIRQKLTDDAEGYRWSTMGIFTNHSLIEVRWSSPSVLEPDGENGEKPVE